MFLFVSLHQLVAKPTELVPVNKNNFLLYELTFDLLYKIKIIIFVWILVLFSEHWSEMLLLFLIFYLSNKK